VLHRRVRKILTLALLLALGLPALVTAAIAVHEATHHRHSEPSDEVLITVVHGHHHGQEIEPHAHEAVAAKVRVGTTVETPATEAFGPEHRSDTSSGSRRSVGDRPLLEPPRTAALCVWQL
jgi:hypothetical protein